MKLKSKYVPEACASSGPSRVISHAYLLGDKIVATDGRTLTVIPVEREEGDTDGPLTASALKEARKQGRTLGTATLKANGALVQANGATEPRPAAGEFPSWEQVVPADRDAAKITGTVRLTFSPELLENIVKALGDPRGVTLTFTVDNGTCEKPIIVRGLDDAAAKAVLMPMRA